MDYENLKQITINDYIKFLLEPIFPQQLQAFKENYAEFGTFKEPANEFDDRGLRYDLEFLQKVKTHVCFLPVQLMANFVDKVTFDFYRTFDEYQINKFDINAYHTLNATSVGNTAFIYLNTTNDKLRQRCYEFLTELIRYEIELSGLTAHFKQPQVIKPNFQA